MIDCENLVHPFQHDPGVSQRQRVMEDLLSGTAEVDGRSLADLLDYFMQLSHHIKFYEEDLSVSDWQPFFHKSLPFTVAAMSKFDSDAVEEKLAFYHQLSRKNPSSSGLQLLIHFLYYRLINPLNSWQMQTHGSELPVAFALEKLIKDKLQRTVKEFIRLTNLAVKWYCIKPVDWQRLHKNEVWNLSTSDLHDFDETIIDQGTDRRERKIALYDAIRGMSPAFFDVMRLVAGAAVTSIDQSLVPLKAELQEKHQPHLALLFAFLKLFQHLQSDLNSFTKKHLDFFYKQVLQLEPREAVPDKAHIVFEIQKQLDSYLLEKGLLVKDGKDDNKAEVLFTLDDEIVVNKTQVVDKRTLFLNNQMVSGATYVEGVYMAPDAGKADGIDKDFKENGLNSFPTLGAKNSKYTDPEHGFIKPYPNARLGFILASPVLLLNEGKRTVEITLECELQDNYCGGLAAIAGGTSDPCCEEKGEEEINREENKKTVDFKSACELYAEVKEILGQSFYYISQDLIFQAQKKGISADVIERLKNFLTTKIEICYCETDKMRYDAVVLPIIDDPELNGFEEEFTPEERQILAEFFKPRRALNLLFSGEKEWIEPSEITVIELQPPEELDCDCDPPYPFTLTISVVLEADKPAVTFYNADKLKEDFNTTLPLVKIELDDKIKLEPESDEDETEKETDAEEQCCLERDPPEDEPDVSLYHFFRNVIINDTTIDVEVCGLKNFVVQNDESVQDVNNLVYPFGTRPKVGANFYISSKEIFCKNWIAFGLRFKWKDKPNSLENYYHGYEDFLTGIEITDFNEDKFFYKPAFLENGIWQAYNPDKKNLFSSDSDKICPAMSGEYNFFFKRTEFSLATYSRKDISCFQNEIFTNNSRDSFLKLSLYDSKGLAFQHSRYSYVLARQMMALGKWPQIYIGPVYDGIPNPPPISNLPVLNVDEVFSAIMRGYEFSTNIRNRLDGILIKIKNAYSFPPPPNTSINFTPTNFRNTLGNPLVDDPPDFPNLPNPLPNLPDPIPANAPQLNEYLLKDIIDKLEDSVLFPVYDKLKDIKDIRVVIPNEPYTPQIQGLTLDYQAKADKTDIDLIHLYPYEGTYKPEELESNPTLLPTFCDEGTLFLGLKDLVPGSSVNMLFQLAEATADSESEREELHWFYLDNNEWKLLREGFEVLDDATDGLTSSGVIKFALPANMTSDNTILPKGLYWIKAAIPQNSRSVSETIGIHTQAVQVTFTNNEANDKMRLANALPAGSVAKLKEADASVKKVNQPYDGFGGRLPEATGHFYVRTSELLRHKGRSIQKFDYERLALEAFPTLFKVKCINHSFGLNAHKYFNDFPVAPGYVLLAVIPDLNQLKAAVSFKPRAPVSLLEKVKDYLGERTSPFVRLKIMNPRYEKVHFCLKVKLYLNKDENYYKEKLKQDLREFLAPWAVGQYDKLTFGQCIYKSDIVRFLESRDYMDYIIELRIWHEKSEKCQEKDEKKEEGVAGENGMKEKNNLPICKDKICPITPRSILIAGDIDVCIKQQDCEIWEPCEDKDWEEEGKERIDYREIKVLACCDPKAKELIHYCEEHKNN